MHPRTLINFHTFESISRHRKCCFALSHGDNAIIINNVLFDDSQSFDTLMIRTKSRYFCRRWWLFKYFLRSFIRLLSCHDNVFRADHRLLVKNWFCFQKSRLRHKLRCFFTFVIIKALVMDLALAGILQSFKCTFRSRETLGVISFIWDQLASQ